MNGIRRNFSKIAITLIFSILLSLTGINVSNGSVNPTSYQTTIGTPVTIKGVVNDVNGNPIASTNISVTSDTPDVPNQTINTNSQGSFFLTYTPKASGTDHITFTINSTSSTATVTVLQGSPQSISLQSSTGSTYSSAPLTITAGQSINLKGNVTGLYNSPIAGANVVISSPTDGTDNFMPSGTITTDSSGNFTDSSITMTQAGTQYIQATTGGVSSPSQVQINVQPALPNKISNLQANPVQIGAGSTTTVTGTLQDQYGSPIPNANLTLVGPDTTTTVTTQAGGLFTASQKITTPGMATLKVQYNGSTLQSGTVSVNVLPTGAYNLSINLSSSQVTAGNSLSATITLKDNTGATVSGKTLTLAESPTSSALIQTSVTTDSNGQAVVTVGPVTKAGYESLTATMDGVANVIGTATFKVVPASPAQVYSSVSPSTTQVNTNVMVFGSVTDTYANPIIGASVTVLGGYGANVTGSANSNGYYNLSIRPVNIGGPFALSFSVTSTNGNYNTIQGNITVTAPIVVPVQDVLAGVTIAGQTGTMTNRGAYTPSVSSAVGGGTLYTRILQGAYLTNTVSGYPEITTSVPDLQSGNILGGKNILGVPGGITNMPGTYTSTWYWADGNGALNNWIPYGAYLTDSGSGSGTPNLRVYDPNFIASNIKSGVPIFGLTGTYSGTVPTHGTQSWTTPGTYTWTVPAGVNSVMGIATGGGGGGFSETYNNYLGCGGGGGGTNINMINVTPGQVLTITVGSGGAAHGYRVNADPGGASSIDSLLAYGGSGGRAYYIYQGGAAGGTGGGYGGYGGSGQLSAYSSTPAYGGAGMGGYGNGGTGYYSSSPPPTNDSSGRVVISW